MNTINLKIIDEFNKTKKYLGQIKGKDITPLISKATEKNMKCLSLIDEEGSTYFNEGQILVIKEEINQLQDNPNLNHEVLNLIKKGADKALASVYLYLTFEAE